MSPRSAGLSLFALAALAGLVLLLGRLDRSSPTSVPGPAADAAAPAPEAEPPRPAASESPRRAARAEPPAGPTVEVLVLREGTRDPVAGCDVALCDMDRFHEALGAARPAPDWPARRRLFLELAATGRTDDAGRVRLPLAGERHLVDATRADGLWGRALLTDPTAAPFELLVAEDRTLRAVVRSASDGAPVAGVPVVLCSDPARSPGRTGLTAADGAAVFAHAQETVTGEGRWHLGLGLPVCAPRLRALAPGAQPEEPVELRLPPTGTLELELRDEAGRPVPGDAVRAELAAFTSPARAVERPCQGTSSAIAFDAAGRAHVGFVGLDLPLRVTVRPRDPGSPRPPLVADVDGPRRAGETVACELAWTSEAGWPTVTGRLVRADGAPWPAARLEARVELFPTPRAWPAPRELALDDGGRFRFVVYEPCPPSASRALRLRCLEPHALAGIEGRLELSRELPPGETDLGDVLLDRGPLLVAGRVVDEEGRPLAGARLDLCRLVEEGERERWPRYDCAGGSSAAADGSFALRALSGAELPRADLRLHARCAGHVPAQLDVALGQTGLRVVLPRAGAIAGSVRLAPGEDASGIAVVLRGEDGGWTAAVRPDGGFRRGDLPPGSLTLVAWRRDAPEVEPRAVVEDLVIVAGETCRDPRVQGLELPGEPPRFTLEIVDEAGRPVAGASVETSEGLRVRSDARGLAAVRARELPVDLHVRAYGHRALALHAVAEDRRVVLAEGLWVRLVTDARTAGRDPTWSLGFWIRTVDAEGRRGPRVEELPLERLRFDAEGVALLALPAPGEYSVEPRVHVAGADGVGRGAMLSESAHRRLHVLDTAAVQTLRVEIPQELVDAAVRGE